MPPVTLAAPLGMPWHRFEPAPILADPNPDISRAAIIASLVKQQHDLRVQCIVNEVKIRPSYMHR